MPLESAPLAQIPLGGIHEGDHAHDLAVRRQTQFAPQPPRSAWGEALQVAAVVRQENAIRGNARRAKSITGPPTGADPVVGWAGRRDLGNSEGGVLEVQGA